MDKGVALKRLTHQLELEEQLALEARAEIAAAVKDARDAGATWAEIGQAAGMAAQSAHERWADAL
jgi:hypothetical protein